MKTILITRPEHQAHHLSALIEAAGGRALLFPTIIISPILPKDAVLWVKQVRWAKVVIFTSANAVECAMPYIREALGQQLVIPVGPGTAQVLKQYSVEGIFLPERYNSAGIIAWLSDHGHIKNNILIICGENSRPYLKEELVRRGALVDKLECYRRSCPHIADSVILDMQQQAIDAIVTTSAEGLKNLCDIFGAQCAWLYQHPVIVISPEMKELALQYGFQQVWVAKNATDRAVIDCLQQYI